MKRFVVSILYSDSGYFIDDCAFDSKYDAEIYSRLSIIQHDVLHVRVYDALARKFVFSIVDSNQEVY